MKIPKENKTDKVIKVIKIGTNLIPVIGGSLTELFDAIVTPPIQKRRIEWMQMIGKELQKLHELNNNKIQDILNNTEFQSLLINASICAFKTHQIEKTERLKNGLLNSIKGDFSYEINQQFINFIDILSLLHINLLNYIFLCHKELKNIDKVSTFFEVCKNGALKGIVCNGIHEIEISTFRFLLKDLESKGLIMLSPDLNDIENTVFKNASILLKQNKTKGLPYILITQFGIDFINFIKK